MICKKCGYNNIEFIDYCSNCGEKFLETEKQNSYDKTIFGLIDKIEDLIATLKLQKITSHPIFRAMVLVAILLIGLFLTRVNGNEMTVLKSENYLVQQNSKNNDFYILTDENQIDLLLYLPRKVEKLQMEVVQDEKVLNKTEINLEEGISLKVNKDGYYVFLADYGEKSESITVYVLPNDSN